MSGGPWMGRLRPRRRAPRLTGTFESSGLRETVWAPNRTKWRMTLCLVAEARSAISVPSNSVTRMVYLSPALAVAVDVAAASATLLSEATVMVETCQVTGRFVGCAG